LFENLVDNEHIIDPGPCPEEVLLKVHTQSYYKSLVDKTLSSKEEKRLGLPLHDHSIKNALESVGGTSLVRDSVFSMTWLSHQEIYLIEKL